MLYDSEAVIRKISDKRLTEGGAAIFAPVNRNHHSERMGRVTIMPLDRVSLRVCVNS